MKKYLFVFLLISVIVGLPIILYNYWRSDLELIFILDSDNYDILEFVFWDNNAVYVIFLLVNLFVVNLVFSKNYFNKFFADLDIFRETNFTNRLNIRSPPFC